jgi:hypothetical protein
MRTPKIPKYTKSYNAGLGLSDLKQHTNYMKMRGQWDVNLFYGSEGSIAYAESEFPYVVEQALKIKCFVTVLQPYSITDNTIRRN